MSGAFRISTRGSIITSGLNMRDEGGEEMRNREKMKARQIAYSQLKLLLFSQYKWKVTPYKFHYIPVL